MRRKKNKKPRRYVAWVCDKSDCGASNTREVQIGYVLIDDVCDYCHRRIHEPVTEDVKNWDTPNSGKQ
jgi:hypothetical protein